MEVVLELKNVSKNIGRKKILDNISFQIKRGEVFGFLGPNGAGKTTTLKIIIGLLNMDEGRIIINGNDIKSSFEEALMDVGGIIENPDMYGYLTGLENLKIFGGMYKDISKERIDEVIKLVRLEKYINDKVKTYSLGMRQRLGVAQAILHKPKLLILDEPTNGLDPMGIKELRDTLKYLTEKEGLAVLVSSHLLNEMELMCDRFGIISSGKIIDIKTLKDIKVKNKGANVYSLDISNLSKAKKLINSYNKKIELIEKDSNLNITVSREEIARINKLLIENHILVYEISIVTNTLEDEFMKITNEYRG